MPSLQHLPTELKQHIAGYLSSTDLSSLSRTNSQMYAALGFLWSKRIQTQWAKGKEILFHACATGNLRVAKELVQTLGADPSLGLATTGNPFCVFGDDNHKPLSIPHGVKEVSANNMCQFSELSQDSLFRTVSHLVRFDENYRLDDDPHHAHCGTSMLFPLHLAVASGNVEMVRFLIQNTWAHLEAPCLRVTTPENQQEFNRYGYFFGWFHNTGPLTPLSLAISNKHAEIAELLLQYGASPNVSADPNTPLAAFHVALGVEGTEMTQLCIDRGIYDIHEPNYYGLPPIWLAYLNKNWEAFDLLLTLGANVNHDLGKGFTPFLHALFKEDYEIVKRLLAAGSDISIPLSETPQDMDTEINFLVEASEQPTPRKPFELWIKHKFRPANFHTNIDGNHEFMEEQKARELLKFFDWLVANKYVDVNEPNHDGVPLTCALFRHCSTKFCGYDKNFKFDRSHMRHLVRPYAWRTTVLKHLLDMGADPMAQDTHGNTVLDMCLFETDLDSYKLVSEYTPNGEILFGKFWTLDKVMEMFAWPEPRTRFTIEGPLPEILHYDHLWEVFTMKCLEMLLDWELITRAQILDHPDFAKLLCSSLHYGERCNVAQFLLGLHPPLDKITERCYGRTPMYYAIESNRFEVVRKFLDGGVDPNQTCGHWGDTGEDILPIIQALYVPIDPDLHMNNHTSQLLVSLIKKGAKVHVEGGDESTNPIMAALDALIGELARGPPDRPRPIGWRPFGHDFMDFHHYQKQLQTLLQYHPLTEASESLRQTYIQKALHCGNSIPLRLLLTYGADPNCILDDGHTPMTKILSQLATFSLSTGFIFDKTHISDIDLDRKMMDELILFGADLDLVPTPRISGSSDAPPTYKSPKAYIEEIVREAVDRATMKELATSFSCEDEREWEESHPTFEARAELEWYTKVVSVFLKRNWLGYDENKNLVIYTRRHSGYPDCKPYPIPPPPKGDDHVAMVYYVIPPGKWMIDGDQVTHHETMRFRVTSQWDGPCVPLEHVEGFLEQLDEEWKGREEERKNREPIKPIVENYHRGDDYSTWPREIILQGCKTRYGYDDELYKTEYFEVEKHAWYEEAEVLVEKGGSLWHWALWNIDPAPWHDGDWDMWHT